MGKKQGFDVELIKAEVLKELDKARGEGHRIFEFSNSDLNVFGAVIVVGCMPEIAETIVKEKCPKEVPEIIRKYGATNSVFLLKIEEIDHRGANNFFNNFLYLGWIVWNSIKILVPLSEDFFGKSGAPYVAYGDGLNQLFKSVDDVRFALRLSKEAHKRIQNIGIEFKPE